MRSDKCIDSYLIADSRNGRGNKWQKLFFYKVLKGNIILYLFFKIVLVHSAIVMLFSCYSHLFNCKNLKGCTIKVIQLCLFFADLPMRLKLLIYINFRLCCIKKMPFGSGRSKDICCQQVIEIEGYKLSIISAIRRLPIER